MARGRTEDIENGTGNVADLTESEGRIEGAENVGCNEVEDGGPACCAESAAGIDEFLIEVQLLDSRWSEFQNEEE